MFKMKDGDYELIFEYDTQEELESYLTLANKIEETKKYSKADYDFAASRIKKEAEKDYGEDLNFLNLEYKFVEAKRKVGKVSPATYRAYASTFRKLEEHFYKKEISNISIDDYENFRDFLAKKHNLKNKTINNHITYLNKFLDFAVSRKLIRENNLKGIESLKEEEVNKENFTDKDIENIFAYNYEQKIRDYFIIAAYSGMRSGEIHQLTNNDIIKVDDIYIFDIKDSKTKAGLRKVPIHKDILEQVLKMDFPIFKNKTKDAAQKILNRRLYQVIDKGSTKSFHTFRAKFIEKAINAHPDKIPAVQEVVGHSKNEKDKLTIDIYAKGFKLPLKADIVNSVQYDLGS
jgi:integrase